MLQHQLLLCPTAGLGLFIGSTPMICTARTAQQGRGLSPPLPGQRYQAPSHMSHTGRQGPSLLSAGQADMRWMAQIQPKSSIAVHCPSTMHAMPARPGAQGRQQSMQELQAHVPWAHPCPPPTPRRTLVAMMWRSPVPGTKRMAEKPRSGSVTPVICVAASAWDITHGQGAYRDDCEGGV